MSCLVARFRQFRSRWTVRLHYHDSRQSERGEVLLALRLVRYLPPPEVDILMFSPSNEAFFASLEILNELFLSVAKEQTTTFSPRDFPQEENPLEKLSLFPL